VFLDHIGRLSQQTLIFVSTNFIRKNRILSLLWQYSFDGRIAFGSVSANVKRVSVRMDGLVVLKKQARIDPT
jgi:uncharacterized membrane protein YfbV (UPF0208 family)